MNFIDKFDLGLIKWIQNNLRNPFFDYLFYIITQLGDMYAFILIVVVIYWLIDKKFAYKFLFAFIGSAAVNNVFKVIFKRPRPFTHEGVESVFTKSRSYSFPSGHSQAIGVTFYSLKKEYGRRHRIINYILFTLVILVPFSRMYLGQHFLTDVVVGTIIGIVFAYLMFKLFDLMKDKEHIYPLYVIPFVLIGLAFLIGKDYEKYHELFISGAGFIGFISGYAIDKLYIKHDVNTTVKNKILKLIIGLAITLGFYLGLKEAFPKDNNVYDFFRYLAVSFFISAGAPYLFVKIFKSN